MDIVPIYRSSSGLNTQVDSTRIKHDPETGISDLAIAVNVFHDDTGMVSSRTGYELLVSGAYHSMFCDGGACLVAIGGDLYQVGTDFSLLGLRGSMRGSRIGYCQVGDVIFYSNDFDNGIIIDGASYDWPINEYEGPKTARIFSTAPVGLHIAFFNGRWYISDGNIVWYSEPHAPGLFDKARCFFQFDSPVRMIKPVKEGLFISDGNAIWFFRGDDPSEFTQKQMTSFPVLEWSDSIEYIEGYEIGLENPGLCALWGTTEGAMLGTADGRVVNLTKGKVEYPGLGNQGSGLLRDNHFIHSMFF